MAIAEYNLVGAGSTMKLGPKGHNEAIGKPGDSNMVKPSMAAKGEAAGLEQARPGGAEKVMGSMGGDETGMPVPGGSEKIMGS